MADDSQQASGGGSPASRSQQSRVPTGQRKAGRELALSVMCALEAYDADDVEARTHARALTLDRPPQGDADGEAAFSTLARSPGARAFAEELLDLWGPRSAEVDALIERVSRRWRLARMDAVDRNVVRLAAVELSARPDTPRAVVLAEAVRVARRYGSDKSAPFVNGLVESLAAELRDSVAAGASGPGGGAAGAAPTPNKADGAGD